MELVALVLAAFLQLVSLSVNQLRETVDAIKAALVAQYVDATEGQRLAGVLDRELAQGFGGAHGPSGFAAAVQGLLQRESRDRHLLMWPGSPVDILKIAPGGRLQPGHRTHRSAAGRGRLCGGAPLPQRAAGQRGDCGAAR